MKLKYPNINVKFVVEKGALPINKMNEDACKQISMSEADALAFLLTVEKALIKNNVPTDECNEFSLQAGNDVENLMAICMSWVTIDFV